VIKNLGSKRSKPNRVNEKFLILFAQHRLAIYSMIEIRFHGRGGQGAVTASRVLAIAAFLEGSHSQSIPMYGTERRGAPVTAFVRIGEKKRMIRSLVHEPDYVIVLDSLLRNSVDITEGLKAGGTVIINSSSKPEELEFDKEYKVGCVDATKVALETIGRPITNTAILGAFAKATGEVKLESLLEAVKMEMGSRMADTNCKAVELAYNRTLVGVNKVSATVRKIQPPTNSRADWRTFRPVVDVAKCTGCQICWTYCPEHCISMVDRKSMINYVYCKGCGICAEECPTKAITMVMESESKE
jgi:2-oxoacid:acceptor oxidoreductase gamma subunit (pyruvate/2-ketoisovalerate family)/2-oxoacid:acceptor oxidoreductase delta subunit (pyruvate/2-ketoisovalerate family)